MSPIPLTDKIILCCYSDGSVAVRSESKLEILSDDQVNIGWRLAQNRGLIYQVGMRYADNLTPLGIGLSNLLQ